MIDHPNRTDQASQAKQAAEVAQEAADVAKQAAERAEEAQNQLPEVITTHAVNGLNKELIVIVHDPPGQGNACHRYQIRPRELSTFDATTDPKRASRLMRACCDIEFQNGPIHEAGVNGISNEVLLAIVCHRLEGFQAGPYACETNQRALGNVIAAMDALHERTKERVSRGVEGTHTV